MPWFSAMKSGSVVKVFPTCSATVFPSHHKARFFASCEVVAVRNIQRRAAASHRRVNRALVPYGPRVALPGILLIALLVAPSGAALVDVAITRLLVMVVPLALLTALGVNEALVWLSAKMKKNRLPAVSLALALLPNLDRFFDPLTIGITLLAALAAYYCFMVDMIRQPKKLFSLLSHLTTIYISNSLLFTIRTIEALTFRKSYFHVTGMKYQKVRIEGLSRQILTADECGYPRFGIIEVFIGIL